MKRSLVIICSCAIVFICSSALFAQQERSLSAKSYAEAREVLEAGIKARGGLEALQVVADVTRELAGTRTDEGQGMQPVPRGTGATPPATNHPKIRCIRDLRGQRAMDEIEDTIFGGQPIKSRAVLTGNTFFAASDTTENIRQPLPAALPSIRAARFRRYPESLLLTAWTRPETLRSLGTINTDGHKLRAISFADADGTEVALYFDAQTGLLVKSEVLGDDPVLGDVSLETIYSDWRPVNKLLLPFRYTDKTNGVTMQELTASSIVLDAHPPDSLYTLPEGYAKIEPTPPTPTIKKLADDVYAILRSEMFIVCLSSAVTSSVGLR
jgi:hypothetical protein